MPRRTSVSLNFAEVGDGVPVLALHGWTPDHRLMLGCMEPVFAGRSGYRRLYPELPGMGKSPAPASIASSDDVLDAVQDFVDDAVGAEPFLLVGESYGGYLARALAHTRPAQVLGLALVCPVGTRGAQVRTCRAATPGTASRARTTGLGRSPTGRGVRRHRRRPDPDTLRRFREDVLVGLDLADADALARIARHWLLSEDPESGEPFTRPTLILTGRQDSSIGYVDQFALLPHYPRASFAVLDMAGHNLQFEQPELFETLLVDWLDRVRQDVLRQ